MLCRRYLICSLTVSGLQKLIDIANMYITSHGLSFNPSKTECIIFGDCYFKSRPSWVLEGVTLTESNFINYLGVTLSHVKPNCHVKNRINACMKAFFRLLGAGLCNLVTDVNTASYV